MNKTTSPPCPGCNGTGQMTSFGGVSRFQFSYDECTECNGTGFLEPPSANALQPEHIAANSTLSNSQLDTFLNILAQLLSETLLQGETVQLRGFGSFSQASSGTRKKQFTFTPSQRLRNSLNDTKK